MTGGLFGAANKPTTLMQIFISHSSLDSQIKSIVLPTLLPIGIYPYFAEDQPAEPNPLHEKLINAISKSKCAFVFITKNVIENKDTRDIILWELGVIHSYNIPVCVFTEDGVEVPKPAWFKSVSYSFKPSDVSSLINVSNQLKNIATKISAELKEMETQERNERLALIIAGIFVVGLGAYIIKNGK